MIKELIESGKGLLKARPMIKDDYFSWSDGARGQLAECFGSDSPKLAEFVKSRWVISTSIESDASMYLSQIGANLRRELRLLEKFEKEDGEEES